jgi:hypothetical protein
MSLKAAQDFLFLFKVEPLSNQANKDKKKAKYEMGNFCEQYGLPSVAPSKKHRKSRKHEEYRTHKKRFKRFKKRNFEPNDFYKKEKRNTVWLL